MLRNYTKFSIARTDGKKPVYKIDDKDKISLITEVENYIDAEYLYSNIVYFKTKKLELLKKRSSSKDFIINGNEENKKTIENVVNYSTPEFVLCGYKKELGEDLFYPNGDTKKMISKVLYKVKWFNSNQMKFSEQYLPKECFIDKQPFDTLVPHNEEKDKKASK
ncbi:hypothetical protein A5M85_00790 [Cellulophaga lytica]|nr:hypothetical protein [Cellulophaga lytica]APU08875.1 hypothetical protein A5M85_00790 [Cellulophaga lytica]